MKPSRLLIFLRLCMIIMTIPIMLIALLFISGPRGPNQDLYEEAIKACPTEVFLIGDDIGYVHLKRQPPYPARVEDAFGEPLLDYACDEQTSLKKIEDGNRWITTIYVGTLIVLVVGPHLYVLVLVLWIVKETDYQKQKRP